MTNQGSLNKSPISPKVLQLTFLSTLSYTYACICYL